MITATNNARLSRRVLWAIIFLYILPGLFARSPWNPDDAIGFGQAYHFVQTPLQNWSISLIGDRLFTQEGLLSAWLAALFGSVGLKLGAPPNWLDDIMRLSNVFWLVLAGWAIWHTAYRLARRTELQPEDPFGNAPTRIDYARSVADASVLCLLSTLGLLVRSHFQVAELAELAGLSLILLASVRSLDRPLGAGWMLGFGVAIAFFARGWVHWLPFLLALSLSSVTHPSLRFCLHKRIIRALLVAGSAFVIWFFWAMSHPQGEVWWTQWQIWNINRFIILDPNTSLGLDLLITAAKTSAWFLWPILPMSAWTIWRYRNATREPAIRIPIFATVGALLTLLLTNPAEEANYFPLLAPLSVLAAIGLSTMRRSLVGLIDWFALLCFSFGAILVWMGWSAATFGWPEKMAANFEKLSPGYISESPGPELVIALLATLAWIRLIAWRTGRSNTKSKALWRPMVLSCGGVTLIWLLLMTLWIPRIDYAKNFGPVSASLKQAVLSDHVPFNCLIDYDLGFAERSVLEYHTQLLFKSGIPSDHDCNHLILEDSLKTQLIKKQNLMTDFGSIWTPIWIGNRNSDRHERFIVFQRSPVAQ